MSSFICDKKEFVKAAGLMSGIESAKQYPHKYFIDHVRQNFERVYKLNVMSVDEQYNEKSVLDPEGYDEVFRKYQRIGYRVSIGMDNDIRPEELSGMLLCFFRSVLYQIENDSYAQEAGAFFFNCVTRLYDDMDKYSNSCWGSIGI